LEVVAVVVLATDGKVVAVVVPVELLVLLIQY
jgi:hypothetical protein